MREGALSRSCELGRCWTTPSGPTYPDELERIPREPRRLLLYARARFDPSPPSGKKVSERRDPLDVETAGGVMGIKG